MENLIGKEVVLPQWGRVTIVAQNSITTDKWQLIGVDRFRTCCYFTFKEYEDACKDNGEPVPVR